MVQRTRLLSCLLFVLAGSQALTACGGGDGEIPPPAAPSPPHMMASPRPMHMGPMAGTKPSPGEAIAFMKTVETDLRRLSDARDRASWVNQNFITDDTETLGAAAEEATAGYITQAILAARKFDSIQSELPADVARKFLLLKIAQGVPAPTDANERSELAKVEVEMASMYGKGKYCPAPTSPLRKVAEQRQREKNGGKPPKPGVDGKVPEPCLNLEDLSNVLSKSRNEPELREAWEGWHATSPTMKPKFQRYVELGNKGSREIGFADMGALWKSGYDMPPAAFEADVDRIWQEVKPFYEELHCYARAKLRAKYGKDVVGEKAPIPAHLLGNMWAQEWQGMMDLLSPYPTEPKIDASPRIKAKKLPPTDMVKIGEKFFTSLGFRELPKTFWERSLFERPRDREVICHASAWNVNQVDDLRIKMCIEPNEDDLVTIHHELGHIFYYQAYEKETQLFQAGANDGFHEAIGDTLALSITPSYLKSIGLLDTLPKNDHAALNVQMKMALSKVAFLPFGLLIDKWRWDVFSGKTPPSQYNAAWWELRKSIQGVAPPKARGEDMFDPGAKYHVPASTPYVRYFLSHIYQFQFYRALCKAAGHTGPLSTCSFYGNKAAGEKLRSMLAMGQSKPWPEAMAAIGAENRADASALLEYFAPLRAYLKEKTRGETCGW